MEQAEPEPAPQFHTAQFSPALATAQQTVLTSDTTTSRQTTDDRFRKLVGEHSWRQLPKSVQARFEKDLRSGQTVVYSGSVVETKLSRAGKALAWLGKAIGTPLPETNGATGHAVVTVVYDAKLGGQVWTRVYARPSRFPQVVHSVKRFCGTTGLEEYVGSGISMALQVSVEDGSLVFRSQSYQLKCGPFRLGIPALLSPGQMTITHSQEANGSFSFLLTLEHPIFGQMIRQLAYFRDM